MAKNGVNDRLGEEYNGKKDMMGRQWLYMVREDIKSRQLEMGSAKLLNNKPNYTTKRLSQQLLYTQQQPNSASKRAVEAFAS